MASGGCGGGAPAGGLSIGDSDEEAGGVVPEVGPVAEPAQGSLMRILLAWSSAVDCHTHEALKQSLTPHVWAKRNEYLEPYE